MDSSNLIALRHFLEANLGGKITYGQLMEQVNRIRAYSNSTYAYLDTGVLYYRVNVSKALYEFKAFQSLEKWRSDSSKTLFEDLNKAAKKPSHSWITFDEIEQLYDAGTVITHSGVVAKEKPWDKKTYEATAKDKNLARSYAIAEYKRKFDELNPMAGDTVQIQYDWKIEW